MNISLCWLCMSPFMLRLMKIKRKKQKFKHTQQKHHVLWMKFASIRPIHTIELVCISNCNFAEASNEWFYVFKNHYLFLIAYVKKERKKVRKEKKEKENTRNRHSHRSHRSTESPSTIACAYSLDNIFRINMFFYFSFWNTFILLWKKKLSFCSEMHYYFVLWICA